MTSSDSLNRDVQQTKEDAAGSFSQLKDDATKVAQSAVEAGKAKVDQLKGKLNDGRDVVQDAAYKARDRGNDFLANLQEQIAEKPIQAVAIAAGVGVVLGIVLRRH